MAKLALLVGIDAYMTSPLAGCVNDATRMAELLSRHADGSPNFECRKLVAPGAQVTRTSLKEAVDFLFKKQAEVALFFFAGHGTVNNLGGYLVTQDAEQSDEGISMNDVLTLANNSPANQRIIMLDCCHSGALGQLPAVNNIAAMITEGVTILSASRESEVSMEKEGGGLFTSLVCAALEGGAADVLGKVTTASVYAYVDEALGGWEQRPLYKNHVAKLMPLRYCTPAVELEILRRLPQLFASPSEELALNPSYEPCEPGHDPEQVKIFNDLMKLRNARLVVPVGAEHLYYAAVYSKSCRLTPLGVHYWNMANSGKL